MGTSIGGVGTFAHMQMGLPNRSATAATHRLVLTTGNGAVDTIAPVEVASIGRRATFGRVGIRRAIIGRMTTTLLLVLSGRQPPAPLVLPSTLMKVARESATSTEKTNKETISLSDHTHQPVSRPVIPASRRGRGTLLYMITSPTNQPYALGIPIVRESWTGAGRRKGRRRNVHMASPDVLASAATKREAMEQSPSLASALSLQR